MLAAARKHKRVVQVGTQRRSTPHLVEARDRIIREGKLGKVGLRRDLLLLPHARAGEPARRRRRPSTSTTRCGPARRRCGRTTSWSTRGAGARSWNTATASWATCASTCSTWCAGCSTSAGRRASAPPAASWWTRRARRTSPTRKTATFDFGDLKVVWKHRTWGDPPDPEVSLGRDHLRRQGHAEGQRQQLRLHPRRRRDAGARGRGLRARAVPRGQDREGPGEARRAGDPRAHEGLACSASQTRGKPVADIEQGYISTTACILANLSLQLGRSLAWDHQRGQVVGDDEANRLLMRPYRAPWQHPGPATV